MTTRPRLPRMCRDRRCTEFTPNPTGYCDEHQRAREQSYNTKTRNYRTPAWRRLRLEVLARDQQQCVVCAEDYRLTAHHIIPREQGGPDSLENLVTLCGRCHSKLEAGDDATRRDLNTHLRITR